MKRHVSYQDMKAKNIHFVSFDLAAASMFVHVAASVEETFGTV